MDPLIFTLHFEFDEIVLWSNYVTHTSYSASVSISKCVFCHVGYNLISFLRGWAI